MTKTSDRITSPGIPLKEARRKFVVKVIYFIYILYIVEGPLRKWFFPGLATPLYFLRDPVVILLYAYCLHRRIILFHVWGEIWFIFAAASTLIGAIPFLLQGFDASAWGLGVRVYWLYMPLAFVIASTVRGADLLQFTRWNLVLAIPYAALIILQYRSPARAWINSGYNGGEQGVEFVALDIVRPMGLFTYTAQNVCFTALLVSLFFSYCMHQGNVKKSRTLTLVSGLSIACISVLSGSRGVYFHFAAILLVTVCGAYIATSVKSAFKISVFVFIFVGVAAFVFVDIFSDAFEAMQLRVEHANRAGPIENRALADLLSWTIAIEKAKFIGSGMGVGTPAIGHLLNRPYLEFSESDLMRNVYELGAFFGGIFIMLRVAFAAHILIVAFRAARAGNPEFLPLAGLAALGFFVAQITFSTLIGFPFWFAAGLVMASTCATRIALKETT